jgi:hypothetical protein
MRILQNTVLVISGITVLCAVAYVGSLLVLVARIKRRVLPGSDYEPSFSDWAPIPRGAFADRYAREAPNDRTLRLTGLFYRLMWYGLVTFVAMDLIRWVVS